MIKWTKELLENAGYEIENARITSVDLSMADHGCLTLRMGIEGKGWGVVYGGYCLGHGYVGADEFDGSPRSIESIMRIMDVVGCSCFNDMSGELIRVAIKGLGETVKIIGNCIEDNWFDAESFYSDKE